MPAQAIIVVLKEITKKALHSRTFFASFDLWSKLSLGELRSTTSALESVFLSFLHTRVTSEEACSLECGLICLVSLKKSLCNAVTDSTCLTGDTAALSGANDVELAFGAGNGEGLVNDELKGFETEVFVDVSLIDGV